MYGIWEQTQNTIFKTLSTSYSPEVNMNREIIEKWIKSVEGLASFYGGSFLFISVPIRNSCSMLNRGSI